MFRSIILLIALTNLAQSLESYNMYIFKYIHEPKCSFNFDDKIKLVVLVKSSTQNFDRREDIRKSTFSKSIYHLETKIIFELGLPQNIGLQMKIEKESKMFRDILQANFTDSYRNLTLKAIMGMRWASKKCSQTDFVLIIDDDMEFSFKNIFKTLQNYSRNEYLYMGKSPRSLRPLRWKKSKYYATYDEFRPTAYPKYAFGAGMLFSFKAFFKITKQIPFVKGFWIEDVYFGMLAKNANISLIINNNFYISGGGKVGREIWRGNYPL